MSTNALRSTSSPEVDLVIEASGALLPIEVKATKRPRLSHISSLRAFRSEYGDASRAGLLLHDGTEFEWLTEDVLAVPWWSVV